MRKFLSRLAVVVVLLSPLAANAQDALLDQVAKAMGAAGVKSIQYTGSGVNFQVGQNYSPDLPWPRFIVKSYTRSVNYETAALRDELVRLQGEDPPRGGGGQPVRGEQRQIFVLNGDFTWTVASDVVNPTPIALVERQLQLWTTPQGVVKAAIANKATVQGRVISFSVPGKYRVRATVDGQNMIERIDAVAPHAVLGDIPVEIRYSDYKDFGGVKFPTKIKQTIGAHPALELTVSDVQPNIAVDLAVPDPIRQTPAPYARVTSQMVAEGVWFLSGGSHNSALIEMSDHLMLVESPLNEERATAVLAEVMHSAGNPHQPGLDMANLPKKKPLIGAGAYTPLPLNAPPPPAANPFSVNLADNIKRLNLAVDQVLPLHGRIVPLAELHKAI